jgi:low temperature requirement protein LtrA
MIFTRTLIAIFWIIGGSLDGNKRATLWIVAAILNFISRPIGALILMFISIKRKKPLGVPFNIEHITERFGLFTILVLGNIIYFIFYFNSYLFL